MSIKNTILVFLLLPLLVLLPKPVIAEPVEIQEQTIAELITFYSDYYNVSSDTIHKVIKCESRYNTNAKNLQGERSYGLVQINLNAHKSITIEQATDENFAIDFLAKNIAKGHGSMWTCYRKLV